eukprot:CAMPEP_0178465698 /NCGR_PEP_ID=MMETSP0689_2-20121128/51498_1 /TAXON_ID=160604 /ORGANISM="Amphidinium massartii, Strain CS-259" /LENGTH=75 /DNA_ID=CAMNT_0020092651 /DNA_START=60 /DNA_END=283 /DNA_ORIENTATION=-
MVERLTYRRHCRYNTKSNKRKTLRTPGGKLVYQVRHKKVKGPHCRYNTKSNKRKTLRTPGGKLVYKKRQKHVSRA